MGRTALLVIDAQVALLEGAWRETEVIAAIARLLAAARAAGALVVFVQHNHRSFAPLMKGTIGWAIHPALAPRPGELGLEKTASDAFFRTGLQELLEAREVSHLVVCGLQTEFCVDATCRSAFFRGFEVTLAADGHTTGDAVAPAATTIIHHNYALANLAHPDRRIRVRPSETISFGRT